MAAPTTEELTRSMERMTHSMQQSRESSEGIVDGFTKLLRMLIPIEAGFKVLNALSGHYAKSLTTAVRTLGMSTAEVLRHRLLQEDYLKGLKAKLDKQEISQEFYEAEGLEFKRTNELFTTQLNLHRQIEAVKRRFVVIGALTLEEAVRSLYNVRQLNEALQEANAAFSHRLQIMGTIAKVQIQTGTAFGNMVNAAKALVRYNLDSKASFADNLKTVVMLHDALGMSTDEAAHLATVVENYARVNFQKVADVVATIVDQTALAASEVANLGMELTRTLGIIQPGPLTTLPQVVQALSGYEAALKEVTGRVGSFQKFIGHLATPEGMMSAGMLGVNLEMIRSQAGIEEIMRRFERVTQNIVGQARGMERVLKLDVMAQAMNMSRNEVNEMIRAVELRRKQTISEITLEQRYRMELMNLDQGVQRLMSSISIFVQTGLYPWVTVLSKAVNWLALFIQKLVQFQAVVPVAIATVGAGVVFLTAKLWSVGKAFFAVATAASIAAKRLQEYSATQIAQAMLTRLGYQAPVAAAGAAGILPKIMTSLKTIIVNPLVSILRGIWSAVSLLAVTGVPELLVIAGASVLLYKIWSLHKQSREEQLNASRKVAERSIQLEQRNREQGYLAMRFGRPQDALDQFNHYLLKVAARLREDVTLTPEARQATLAEEADKFATGIRRAMYTRTITGEPFVRGRFDAEAYEKALVELGRTQVELLKKANDQTDKIMKEKQVETTKWYEDIGAEMLEAIEISSKPEYYKQPHGFFTP